MVRTLLQKHFWLLGCTFLLAAAFIAARTVHVITEDSLAPPTPRWNDTPRGASRPDAIATRPPPRVEALSRLLGVSAQAATPSPTTTTLPRSGRRARLLGTLTSRETTWSLASIQDLDTQRVRSVRVGDALSDARVVVIERERVIVRVDGREEVIDLQPPTQAPVVAASSTGDTSGDDIRRLGENAYEIPGRFLDLARFAETPALQQIRIIPAARDGKPQGFKLFSIRQGSPYEKAGLQNGDILQRVNGMSLDSPEKALEVITLLKSQRHLELELERGGTVIRKTYEVR
ncbi:general secretion pathway protein GspC [Myxococcus stipitatus]|uniref:type II secretion system protein GspC n=1 Tax=Myxococcus stipitatus TaxID=83455 RepID=UPI001F3F6BA4|nr:type II secretion system protein GspC [Myxococcus stipitatus]MCE9671588.1 general secretion pathway protein GspC [Myxococcus stipitatus]